MSGQNSIDFQKITQNVRAARPFVHALTNPVAQSLSANVVLAAGGTPSMTCNLAEISAFVNSADALLVNLGMLEDSRVAVINKAVPLAGAAGLPWLLDPVKVDRSPERLDYARALLAQDPALVRCNASEFEALKGELESYYRGGRGILVVSGAEDHVYFEDRVLRVGGGSELMDRVTAMGCALTAYLAVYLGGCGADVSLVDAAVTGVARYSLAGSHAAAHSQGPGSFAPAFLDALYAETDFSKISISG
ncbi:hydroxyethylthiazole kinase [Polycladidibacter hongkongensis]|uniref:hydroxyethylthiazole kinase n=1 Tax=Polycladidibacter hongkongensis TaxID=1647556 RepID=UPI00082FFEB9|nr:hydroxyethylthiazole kinase [Pseudovibrio hongkongensis]